MEASKSTKDMTQGNALKMLFFFSLPLMFGNIFQQMYTVVDTAIVGRGVGMDALAALGAADWVVWMLLGSAQGFTMGFAVRISQKFGQKDIEGLKQTVGVSVRLVVYISIVALLLGQFGVRLLLRVLNLPEVLRPMAELYVRIIFVGTPAVMFYNFCASVLRAVGDSKTPLKAMVIASIANIVLDSLAVFVLNLGIAGAAIATLIAQCISGIICFAKMRKMPELQLNRSHLKANRPMQIDLMKIGVPVALQNVIIAIGGMCVQIIVNGCSLSFIAGTTATNKLYGILEIAAISYGYAVTTYVGQNYGAKNYERIRRGMHSAAALAIGTSVLIGTIMVVFGRSITMLFISSESAELVTQAGATAYRYLVIMSVCLPILYILYVYRSALQGMGNTVVPMLSGLVEFLMRVIVSLVIALTGYENGIFYAEVIAWTGAAVLLFSSYLYSIRKCLKQSPLQE